MMVSEADDPATTPATSAVPMPPPPVCEDRAVERAEHQEIAGDLRGLLIRLEDRLSAKDARLIGEFIDANELGLALEQMVDALSEDEQPVFQTERADMLRLVARMAMGPRVVRALELVPRGDD